MAIKPETFQKRSNLLLAYGSEVAGAALKTLGFISNQGVTPPQEWKRAVIIGADHIGDVLYRSCSLPALKQGLPNCELHYVAERPGFEIVETNPHITQAHESWEAALKSGPFDAAICFNTGDYWRELRACVKAGIPNRAFCAHKGFSHWMTHPMEVAVPQAFPGYIRDMVALLLDTAADWELRPEVYPTADEIQVAQQLHEELDTKAQPSGDLPKLACFVTSRQLSGVFPVGLYGEILQKLSASLPTRLYLCGAPGDKPVLEELRRKFTLNAEIICGRLPLRAIVPFLQGCDAVLSTDSGPRHLANAAGTPVFFVRNISFDAVEAGPYCSTDHDFAGEQPRTPLNAQNLAFSKVKPTELSSTIRDFLLQERHNN